MITDLTPEKRFLRGPGFLLLGLGFAAMYLGVMPAGIIGVACLLLPLAFIIEPLGDRIPILKDYLGGAPLLLIFLGAALVHFNVLSAPVVESFSGFMKESGTNFLDFFICSLITGAIFGIHSKLLLKAGLRYAAPVMGAIFGSCALLALVGLLTGQGWAKLVLNIGFPILGGGIGAGAVPMSKVVNGITGQDIKQIMSIFVPAVVLGNVFSIIAAALLNQLGKRYPKLSGNGNLMGDQTLMQEEPKIDFSAVNLVIGAAVACGFYALGKIVNLFAPGVHNLGWMVLAVSVCNITGIVPSYILSACYSWFKFVAKAFVGIVLLAIGIVFTDLGEIAMSITPQYVFLCATVVVGAVLGAGFVGRLVGFHFIESAITAGLCMTDMGGTGDVAVLSAAKRMQLMPFARLSTSIGGGIIIFLCGLVARYMHTAQ
ncbi:MAG: 2-hydroxycarboxylate transporter family protein [Verrucomicrobia bacterium]|nr:2-hydroxycarboxylate transporter family protein [Verrucomicrobiota bacterium]